MHGLLRDCTDSPINRFAALVFIDTHWAVATWFCHHQHLGAEIAKLGGAKQLLALNPDGLVMYKGGPNIAKTINIEC